MSIDPLVRPTSRPDSARLDDLYLRHRRRLEGLAAAVTLDRATAPEVVQDAFAGLASRLDDVLDPVAYLQRSVINLGIRAVRRRERDRSLPLRPIEHSTIPDVDEMWALVVRLPVHQRAVVVLRFWEDLTQEQIADTLGLPLGTVKSTLYRALRTLKEQL